MHIDVPAGALRSDHETETRVDTPGIPPRIRPVTGPKVTGGPLGL